MVEPARILEPGDNGIPEGWHEWSETDDLICGMQDFLDKTNDPDSDEVYRRIRDQAHTRVVLSRLDREP
jgi:hypothetical protein